LNLGPLNRGGYCGHSGRRLGRQTSGGYRFLARGCLRARWSCIFSFSYVCVFVFYSLLTVSFFSFLSARSLVTPHRSRLSVGWCSSTFFRFWAPQYRRMFARSCRVNELCFAFGTPRIFVLVATSGRELVEPGPPPLVRVVVLPVLNLLSLCACFVTAPVRFPLSSPFSGGFALCSALVIEPVSFFRFVENGVIGCAVVYVMILSWTCCWRGSGFRGGPPLWRLIRHPH